MIDQTTIASCLSYFLKIGCSSSQIENADQISSGWDQFDDAFGRFSPGTVSVFGNHSRGGGNELLLNIASNLVLEKSLPVLYISIRKYKLSVRQRIASAKLSIDRKYVQGLEDDFDTNIFDLYSKLQKEPFTILERGIMTPDDLISLFDSQSLRDKKFSCIFIEGGEDIVSQWSYLLGASAPAFLLSFFKYIAIRYKSPVLTTWELEENDGSCFDLSYSRDIVKFADKIFTLNSDTNYIDHGASDLRGLRKGVLVVNLLASANGIGHAIFNFDAPCCAISELSRIS
ncbi:P-loop NTPase family protein [Zhongshania marina]